MNNADKHIAHWSNADVQKYLNGELTVREMHDLEQRALDDPFLADALEGLQTQPGETLHQDLSELRSRLDARVTKKRRTVSWLSMRVAAAVILLVGIGFTVYYTTPDRKHKQPSGIAKRSALAAASKRAAAPPAASKPTVPPPAAIPAPAVAKSSAPPAGKVAKANKTAANEAKLNKTADSTRLAAPIADANARPIARSAESPNTYASTQSPQPAPHAIVVPGRRPGLIVDSLDFHRTFGTARARIGSNADLVAVSGRVLDLNRRPLAGAYLRYKSSTAGTVTGTVTDEKGQFNLYVPQKDSTHELTVAMVGYEDTQYALNLDEQKGNTIYLRQNPARLDEVVVSGIGAQRKEFIAEPPSDAPEKLDTLWLNTAPATGRIAYLDYLATARKNLPVDTTIHGTESISFRVDKKGALTEFRIERSLSPAHDAGVIRLITEGPPWKMLHGRTARALVNVTFP